MKDNLVKFFQLQSNSTGLTAKLALSKSSNNQAFLFQLINDSFENFPKAEELLPNSNALEMLKSIVYRLNPENILNINSFTGTALAACLAASSAKTRTKIFENDKKALSVLEKNLSKAGYSDNLDIVQGDIGYNIDKWLKTNTEQFNLVIIQQVDSSNLNLLTDLWEKVNSEGALAMELATEKELQGVLAAVEGLGGVLSIYDFNRPWIVLFKQE